MTTTTSTTFIISMKWVCLSFFVSVLLISTLAVSSASARRLVVPSETQQTTHNLDKYSFDLHEEPSGREEGQYELDNNDTFGVFTKVPRSADYGNMDGILSVPAIPENAASRSADNGSIDEFSSVSQHNNAEDAVPKNADYVNMDEFHRVFEPKNAEHVLPNNADYVDIDGIPSISSAHYESDIYDDIYVMNPSIYIPRPVTDEPDHEEQFESKDSTNAMEAAAGMPIH